MTGAKPTPVDHTLPDGWQRVRLGDVATLNRLNWDPSDGESILYLDLTAVSSPGVLSEPRLVPASDAPSRARRRVRSGDILVSTVRPNLRGFARVREAQNNLVASTGFAVVTPIENIVESFLYQHVMTPQFAGYLDGATTGQAYPAVRPTDIEGYQVLLPPLAEQQAIAAVLDSIDDAIEGAEAVIAATEGLRDALLHDLLTRGLPGQHTEFRQVSGLGTIPADWDVVRLGNVAMVERGKFAHRPRNEPRFYGGDIPFIQTGDVVKSTGKIKEHSQTLNEKGLAISKLFSPGTIVITIAANIGETAITSYPVAFPDSLVGITPSRIDTTFLEYFLRTRKAYLNELAPESAQKNINLEDLRQLLTPMPTPAEQKDISETLNGVEATVEVALDEAAGLRSLKESTADALLTGRERTQL